VKKDAIDATDDAMLVERLGKTVVVVQGDRTNLKITTPEDLIVAEALLRERRVP
jgi:2-C-methyl-D-erythritol 4-phosphate cytidylyltransferase